MNKNNSQAPANPFDAKLCKSLYFEDGERSIDFVLVWRCDADDKLAEQKEDKRKVFIENLKNEGLELEHTNVQKTFYFVKVLLVIHICKNNFKMSILFIALYFTDTRSY